MTSYSENVFFYDAWDGDLMDRHLIASTLQNYLDENCDIRVLNINAPWGTGKTWFIKRWHDEMRQTRPAIYFNAWKNDYINDPFIAVVSAISEQAKEQMNSSAKITTGVKELGKKAASAFVAAAPGLINAIIKHKLGVDVNKIMESADEEAIGELSEKAVEALINSNKAALDEVEDFRQELGRLATQLSFDVAEQASARRAPLYVFIDELDRCRPTYSIELLERVKHFFDVDNCKFVIASDTAQLSHSVSAVYGSGFDSRRYLRRFFDVEFELINDNVEQWVISELEGMVESCVMLGVQRNQMQYYVGGRRPALDVSHSDVLSVNESIGEQHIVAMAVIRHFSLDMRTFKQCIERVDFVLSNIDGKMHFLWALYLVVLNKINLEDYKFFKSGGRISEGVRRANRMAVNIYLGERRYDLVALAEEYRNGIKDPAALRARLQSTSDGTEARLLESIFNCLPNLNKYYQLVELSYRLGS